MISVLHSDFELNGLILTWSVAVKNRRLDEIDKECHKEPLYGSIRQELMDYQDKTFWINTRHLPSVVIFSAGQADFLRRNGTDTKRFGMSEIEHVLYTNMPFSRRSVKKHGPRANKYHS